MSLKSFGDLECWKAARALRIFVAQNILSKFPVDEKYALTSQLKRSSRSVSDNIAEGFGRNSYKSYINFLKIARGSLFELETQLIIAENQNFFHDSELYSSIKNLILEEGKMINSYISKLEQRTKNNE